MPCQSNDSVAIRAGVRDHGKGDLFSSEAIPLPVCSQCQSQRNYEFAMDRQQDLYPLPGAWWLRDQPGAARLVDLKCNVVTPRCASAISDA